MNFSRPILICQSNEETRLLTRDMLTKNGFFHVVEASTTNEILEFLNEKKDYLVLIESNLLNSEIDQRLLAQKNFLVFVDHLDPKTLGHSTKLGLTHLLSYPVHAKKLMEKISSLD